VKLLKPSEVADDSGYPKGAQPIPASYPLTH
jgi:hypothetical protein